MRSKKGVVTTAVALLLVASAIFASAQLNKAAAAGEWAGMPMGHRHLAHMAKYLDLTDAQKTQIKTMWEQEKPTVQPLIQQLVSTRKDMMAATSASTFDQAKVQTLATQQSQTMAQLIVARQKLQWQIYNQVLNADQRAKVDQLQQKRTARMDHMLQRLSGQPATANQ